MKNIFRTFLLSLVGLLFFSPSQAQKAKQKEHSLLWKISGKDLKQSSYLFGTVHVICEQDYFWTTTMQKALDQSAQLCLEMNIGDPNLISEAGMMMVDLSGGTLRDYFKNESDYQLVAHFIEDSLGQNMEIASHMKPVALYMMYSIGMVKGPCKETVSYEMKLIDKVKNKGEQVVGLETLSEQMEMMESIPTDTIIQQMIDVAQGKNKGEREELQQLIAAYKKQDLVALNKLMIESENTGVDPKVMIDDRNKKWIAPMSKMMNERSTFFAVGAGHVYGLLDLLKAAGYTVEAVK